MNLKLFKRPTSTTEVEATPPQAEAIEFHSLISSHMCSHGNIRMKGNLRIEGSHIGTILKEDGTVEDTVIYVAEEGHVDGEIAADIVVIDGLVKGKVTAYSKLIIRGSISGEAYYGRDIDLTGKASAKIEKIIENTLDSKVTSIVREV